ncbi:MAG TPA: hypothetical protein VKW78_06895 [Terriglobales bacterium]|nr:hypothetical protein [Terriglobales bacterium]
MTRRLTLFVALSLFAVPAAAIIDQYRTGILVHARPSRAEGKNCVTLTVLVGDLVFVAQQCANLPWNAYVPAEFTEQGDVQVRVEEDKLLLRRPNGKDLRAHIVKRALLRQRVDLQDFWRRNAQDRDEDSPMPLPDSLPPTTTVQMH